jgi:hypothetical protein
LLTIAKPSRAAFEHQQPAIGLPSSGTAVEKIVRTERYRRGVQMMTLKCSQCPTQAMYIVNGDDQGRGAPLCLACYGRNADIQFRQFLMAAAGANQAQDDMDFMVGYGPSGGRIPVEALARAASMSRTYNNIRISNSNVGVLNTGNLARIDAAITISQGTEAAEFGARLKDLIQAIDADKGATADVKKELVEVATAISDQAVSRSPSKTVISTLFEKLVSMSAGLTQIAAAADTLHKAWQSIPGN